MKKFLFVLLCLLFCIPNNEVIAKSEDFETWKVYGTLSVTPGDDAIGDDKASQEKYIKNFLNVEINQDLFEYMKVIYSQDNIEDLFKESYVTKLNSQSTHAINFYNDNSFAMYKINDIKRDKKELEVFTPGKEYYIDSKENGFRILFIKSEKELFVALESKTEPNKLTLFLFLKEDDQRFNNSEIASSDTSEDDKQLNKNSQTNNYDKEKSNEAKLNQAAKKYFGEGSSITYNSSLDAYVLDLQVDTFKKIVGSALDGNEQSKTEWILMTSAFDALSSDIYDMTSKDLYVTNPFNTDKFLYSASQGVASFDSVIGY
ncbi:hypothetical protein [Vaginisenegalia massiliensis]|uniref:hypothetical protein n=1 Tax=Vaginisenegalia massiliensis TaxID=2058294 RepID=UPI000F53FB5B|nr:hypothetical protein [Vaginisenegalia massiliensis]